ncbi:hypothetical protein [Hydrogenophaga sp. OTU3427]|uniref:hypothetical protein n=1 Tax=Hydrogenophaga sp. OTU3427 TaxID=3043856 RepID=UPI00313E4D73
MLLAALACHSKEMACPVEHAIRAEKQLESLQSWADAATYYQASKACIDGGVSEGYTNFLASKLAGRDGMTSLWMETEKQRWFRAVIAKRMQSESTPLDTTEKILENLKSHCPQSAKKFCHDMRMRIKKTRQACDPEK